MLWSPGINARARKPTTSPKTMKRRILMMVSCSSRMIEKIESDGG
jgi:hypothetical protein